MQPFRRRCQSEQLVNLQARPGFVPPHKAAKLREAQLSRESAHRKATKANIEWPTHIRPNTSSTRHNKQPTEQKSEAHAKSANLQRQVDGTDNLPSIDAVLASSNDCDKDRTVAETEFYEHTDADGVVKRRSIMRAVNKDDVLVVRGANPRTGLITPDANSLAGSLYAERKKRRPRQGPSAQWRLEGDQWISSPADDPLPDDRTRGRAFAEQSAGKQRPPPVHGESEGTRKVTPLTESNLKSLSTDEGHAIPHPQVIYPPDHTAPNVSKVRRKPVGSPAAISASDKFPERSRCVSEETVVHTPFLGTAPAPPAPQTEYFSPDDVGPSDSHPQQYHDCSRLYRGKPFLGMPVRPRNLTGPQQIRDLTGAKPRLEQLQRSLRTSSGPFPSHPLRSQMVSTEMYAQDPIYPSRTIRNPDPGSIDTNMGDFHRRVPPALLPDSTIPPHPSHLQRRRPQADLPGHRRMQEHVALNQMIDENMLGPTLMSEVTDNPLMIQDKYDQGDIRSMSRRQEVHANLRGIVNTKQDVQVHHALGHMYKDPILHKESCQTRRDEVGGRTDTRPSHGRPKLGSRKLESLDVPKKRSGPTTMVSKGPSNKTGTRDNAAADVEEEQTNGSMSKTDEIASQRSTAASRLGSSEGLEALDAANELCSIEEDERDHTICCPECCTTFDCHEGCLGHPTPAISVADSETSSLASMGVFDASFATSVKQVNEVLLTPDKQDGKIHRFRSALADALRPSSNLLARNSPKASSKPKMSPIKRTLRDSPPHARYREKTLSPSKQGVVNGHTEILRREQAASAAKVAIKSGQPNGFGRAAPIKTSPVKESPVREAPDIGRRGRDRVVSNAPVLTDAAVEAHTTTLEVKLLPVPQLTLDDDQISEPCSIAPDEDKVSIVGKIGALVRRTSISPTKSLPHQAYAYYTWLAFTHFRQMLNVFLDTFSNLYCMFVEYKKTGTLTLPEGIYAADLFANCLRSILYLMIAACLYALVVRVSRVVLVVLRIIFLPVKLVAWVAG